MNHEMRIAALDELIQAEGIDGTINLLADRIQETIKDATDDVDRVQRAGRAYELRNLTRDAEAVLMHDENSYCNFCSQRKPKAQMGAIRGLNRCHECEAGDPEGWHNETNSQYELGDNFEE